MARTSAPRSKEQIEADIAAARARLSANVEELIDGVQPRRIAERQMANAKSLAAEEFHRAKSQVIDDEHGLRLDRVAIIGGSVAGLVTFIVIVRALVNRSRRRG